MKSFGGIGGAVLALSLGLALAGCGSFDPTQFDPTAIFESDIFNTKKPLPGQRQPVFPEGTPGVTQGVPEELVKGHQAQQAQEPQSQATAQQAQPAEAKPKAQPKPKVVAKPKDESRPTAITVRPSQPQTEAQAQPQAQPPTQPQTQAQWPDPPPMVQQQPASGASSGSWAPSAGQVAWPDSAAPR
jgi:hypothetical protein